MTATYVAVTAAVVLLTELVIFGVAALSPPTPLTRQAVQALAQATADGLAAKVAKAAPQLGSQKVASLADDLIRGRALARASAAGRRRRRGHPPADDGGLRPRSRVLRRRRVPGRHRARLVLSGVLSAGQSGRRRAGGVPRKVLSSFVRWPLRGSGQERLPAGDMVWATAPVRASPAGGQAANAQAGPARFRAEPRGHR